MNFTNFPKKFSFSFLTFIVVLLFIASITFGTINSSAHSNDSQQKTENSFLSNSQTKRFSFLPNNIAAFLNGNDVGQNGFSPESRRTVETADSPIFASLMLG